MADFSRAMSIGQRWELQPVFRFAPSPNGFLHLGHAFSALLNQQRAEEMKGRFLLRIEDIDRVRCKPSLIEACFEDLHWLGLRWDESVLRQSGEFTRYRATLEEMRQSGLLYPCFCSRNQVVQAVERRQVETGVAPSHDPDGAPVYPGTCRRLSTFEVDRRLAEGQSFALRLDMAKALMWLGKRVLSWHERGGGEIPADPALWGDVILARKETPTSYHLAVVMDDALQGVTHVVRGTDLFQATALHRLLQDLLGLPQPFYEHHPLILDDSGEKLAKSRVSTPLRSLRAEGVTPDDIRRRLGFF